MSRTIQLPVTEAGLPVLYEHGGGLSTRGDAMVIADPRGEPLEARWYGKHAAFRPRVGLHIVRACYSPRSLEIAVERISALDGNKATLELVAWFLGDRWDPALPAYLEAAVEAARKKMRCLRCEHAHFIAEDWQAIQQRTAQASARFRSFSSARSALAAEVRLYRRYLREAQEDWVQQELRAVIGALREFGRTRLPR